MNLEVRSKVIHLMFLSSAPPLLQEVENEIAKHNRNEEKD